MNGKYKNRSNGRKKIRTEGNRSKSGTKETTVAVAAAVSSAANNKQLR